MSWRRRQPFTSLFSHLWCLSFVPYIGLRACVFLWCFHLFLFEIYSTSYLLPILAYWIYFEDFNIFVTDHDLLDFFFLEYENNMVLLLSFDDSKSRCAFCVVVFLQMVLQKNKRVQAKISKCFWPPDGPSSHHGGKCFAFASVITIQLVWCNKVVGLN